MKNLILASFLLIALFSCKKETLVTVTGNGSPDDATVESTTIERYINRAYIIALGREPITTELEMAKSDLLTHHLDSTSRATFANSIFTKNEYLAHVYDQMKLNYLNNVDTSEFGQFIFVYSFYLTDTTYMSSWPALQYELSRMQLMQNAFSQFTSNQIDIRELQKRMCNNYVYDQINMGSANFVLLSFKHLISRNPTTSELNYGVSMVEGNNSVIFLQAGNSKENFLDILISTNSYYEGQVIQLYNNYLSRLPSAYEMSSGTLLFQSSQDYTTVQKKILVSNEFIGI